MQSNALILLLGCDFVSEKATAVLCSQSRAGGPRIATTCCIPSDISGFVPSAASISSSTAGVNFGISSTATSVSSSWLSRVAPRMTVLTFGLVAHHA
jgi:hypothetical protein